MKLLKFDWILILSRETEEIIFGSVYLLCNTFQVGGLRLCDSLNIIQCFCYKTYYMRALIKALRKGNNKICTFLQK